MERSGGRRREGCMEGGGGEGGFVKRQWCGCRRGRRGVEGGRMVEGG